MPEFQIQVHNLERTVIIYIFAITEDNWFDDYGRLSGSYNCNNTSIVVSSTNNLHINVFYITINK